MCSADTKQINKVNKGVLLFPTQGAIGTNITIKVLCGVMADASLGDPYARYVAVSRFMMDTFSVKCLDTSFNNYLQDMTNTSWDGPAAGGGACDCIVRSQTHNCLLSPQPLHHCDKGKNIFFCWVSFVAYFGWYIFDLITEGECNLHVDLTVKL